MSFKMIRPLFLASRSPRRREFLNLAGIEFIPAESGTGAEPAPKPGDEPRDFVLRAAAAKAGSAVLPADAPDGIVLAADTVVAIDGDILGKPRCSEEAFAMLRRLAGRTHHVLTAVCLRDAMLGDELFVDETAVHFANWPDPVLKAYAASGDCRDKAGAYGIQSGGIFLSDRVEGSWDTVAGLPVCRVAEALLRHRAVAPKE